MIRKMREQRKLLRDINKRTVERMEIMRSVDEMNAKDETKFERRRRIDRDEDHKENNNITQYDEKKHTVKGDVAQRTFFDVRTAARFSALRSQRVSRVGG